MEIARIKSSPLFAGVADEDLERIAAVAAEATAESGATVVRTGDLGFTVFLVEEGTADVVKDGRKVAELGAGDLFGEIAVEQSGRRGADVVATSPMKLIVLMNRDLWKLEERLPAIAATIRETVAARNLQNRFVGEAELAG